MAGQGQMYTFSDTVTLKRTIANFIHMIDPRDVPCVSYFGTSNQNKFKMVNWPNHKYAWLQDTLRTRTATLGEALDTTEQPVTVASGHGIRFKPGDVWRSDETGELMWVISISSDDVTMIRNWAAAQGGSQGTASVGVTDATGLTYQYSARLEGDDSDPSHWNTPTENYNFSQIFHDEIMVSGSEQNASSRYGITDTYRYQLQKKLGGAGSGGGKQGRAGDLMIDLENTFFRGYKVERSSTAAGAMGGARSLITTSVTDLNGARLDQETLETAIEGAWARGGMPDVIICNSFNKRLISSWFKDTVQTERTERTGGVVINKIETEFGNLDIMMNRRCPSNEIYILQREYVGWVTLRDWFVEPLAKAGDYRKDQIIGEFGFVVVNESAHALIIDTATS